MDLARNPLPGTVAAITVGAVMAKVTIDIGNGHTIVAMIAATEVLVGTR